MQHLKALIREAHGNRDGALVTFLGVLALSAMCISSLLCSDAAARFAMGRYHRRGSYWSWAAVQMLPAMYNFRNRVNTYNGKGPLHFPVDQSTERFDGRRLFRYVNHHSYRAVVNPLEAPFPRQGCTTTVLRSDYRGQALRTDFHTCRDANGEYIVARSQ